ncbi:hypothetical protein BEWA_028490 [Theileria equi strain WA]|uniref:Signal peptide containing protein n=1 Tax=Theileria equi strain WA TaxID=1537102 RepID=L0AYN9_THEEQ|nr:hypothetical protein BEWA_028490 [Theileria equi strain WA]AFZ79999.1 hypothetical protein BEWA_028490 [Theileria equi strain WA]|eukprot:XP_004829665.1 hypothetical protein BEWA_028490 [Theileria equi strain WA]
MLFVIAVAVTLAIDAKMSLKGQLDDARMRLIEQSETVFNAVNKQREMMDIMRALVSDAKVVVMSSEKSFEQEIRQIKAIERRSIELIEEMMPKLERVRESSGKLCKEIKRVLTNDVGDSILEGTLESVTQVMNKNANVLKDIDDGYKVLTERLELMKNQTETLKNIVAQELPKEKVSNYNGDLYETFVDDEDVELQSDQPGPPGNTGQQKSKRNVSKDPSREELYTLFIDSTSLEPFRKTELINISNAIENLLKKHLQETSVKRTDVKERNKNAIERVQEFLDTIDKIPSQLRTEPLRRTNTELLKNRKKLVELGKVMVEHIENEERITGRYMKDVKECLFMLDRVNGEVVPDDMQKKCTDAFKGSLIKIETGTNDKIIEKHLTELGNIMDNSEGTIERITKAQNQTVPTPRKSTGGLKRRINGTLYYGPKGAAIITGLLLTYSWLYIS